ncbi:hypothetical protein ACS0TY_001847 [Phlomoides rotata]
MSGVLVLNTLLKLHTVLLDVPKHVPDDYEDNRWRYFKGCLGALDGTYIPVKVAHTDIPRYRNHKGQVSANVLAVCDRNMNYIFVLSEWEGSATDSRVLRDVVTRSSGLKDDELYDIPVVIDGPRNNQPTTTASMSTLNTIRQPPCPPHLIRRNPMVLNFYSDDSDSSTSS